jgi:CRP-like cAMP-binding protein/thioredoxin reductase/Fe-S-cluster-containing hydrogenase component 2
MTEQYKIAIVGAGPAGMSAAARAAGHGISHVLLEAGPKAANTIRRYQKGKLVMAEPAVLPLRSNLSFAAGIRENILERWQSELSSQRVNLRTHATVAAISGQRGSFLVTLSNGAEISVEHVVLALGVQGNIRKLGVAGENLAGVQYQLNDPDEFNNETIVVVGAGDAAVENALALSKQNRVVLLNRDEEFTNCKDANYDLLMAQVTKDRIETRVSTRVERVEEQAGGDFPLVVQAQTPQGLEAIECHRVIARLGANPPRQLLERFGVKFPNSDQTAVPQLSEQYESNVPGMYIIGALAGYPLIKQAMNQGYEVIEYILDNPIEPADEALLKEKFAQVPQVPSVSAGIELIRRNQPLLESLTTLQLREFMLDSTVSAPARGDIIFKRNDYTNSFYSILSGSVTIQTEGKNGAVASFTLSAGNFFGEMGLLSGRRRSGTAVAGENCVLVETPRRSMLKLLHAVPGVKRGLDEVSLKRAVQNYLELSLPEAEFEQLVHEAQLKQYAVGEVLFDEGDEADGLYLIRRGSVTVSRHVAGKEVVLAYVSAGNYVGEMALVSDTPRSATVRAVSPTDVIVLEAERFRDAMGRNAAIRGHVDSRYLERVGADELQDADTFSGLVKFLMAHGVGEATDVLLIDYARCIRCDNCESACANAHDGTARLDREAGATFGQIHLPTACRHCEHPHCMKDCPPDAIHRSVNGEVFISDSCIGCGNCQKNCPYGVIQMAPRREHKQRSVWQIIRGDNPYRHAPVESADGAKIAVKCDMCLGVEGGAQCVHACPTGAAFRVSPEVFFGHVGKSDAGEVE